ncbi:LicD family protein [Campylobacter volucris]|uniref:LicD family protein n=1 Tax=Campylobacter volucris TaxID=1031542 RepID=UPI00189C6CEC|nr:LicD family protein [Campylobacter volucris]MBF7042043.1 LicD family protein [Campylobacter volucris]
MSKIIENQSDIIRLEKLYITYIQSYSQKEQVVINKYLIAAFKKNHDYIRAKEYIKKSITYCSLEVVNKKSRMIKQDAINALKDIKKIFDNIGINFFLVSGTFLGCIRESDFIGYDYDIDIGIWSEDYNDQIKKEILKYGVFIQYDLNWVGGLKLKHINGIKIDIFLHFKENNKIYHQGDVVKWYNTTFRLQKYNFLNDDYYGFEDFDKYLSENYGIWRVKKIDFDNILDTPNSVIINQEAFAIHLYQLLTSEYAKNNKNKILTLLKQYENDIKAGD